jgi:hypothetical protein
MDYFQKHNIQLYIMTKLDKWLECLIHALKIALLRQDIF